MWKWRIPTSVSPLSLLVGRQLLEDRFHYLLSEACLQAKTFMTRQLTAKYRATPNPKIKLQKPERKKSGGENTGSLKQQKEKICIVFRYPGKKPLLNEYELDISGV